MPGSVTGSAKPACRSNGTMPADPVQRRLAAILAADVAGYSRLMGVYGERTFAAQLKRISISPSRKIAP